MAPCVVQIGRAKTITTTTLTRLFALTHPIVLGPMGGAAGGALAAAVSNAGGLGLVGGGYGDADWLRTELAIARADTTRAWGAGLITWSATRAVLDQVLAAQPHAVVLSFGDPRPLGAVIKAAGCKLICQVQDLATAALAREAGADLIVAQGSEGGGHGAGRGTLALVPAVVDAVVPIPVLAAGGIADGRALAAALMLGAEGVNMGTRFMATQECAIHENVKKKIVENTERDTLLTNRTLRNTSRVARNAVSEEVVRIQQDPTKTIEDVRHLVAGVRGRTNVLGKGDTDDGIWTVGQAQGLIHDIPTVAEMVARVAGEAEAVIARNAARIA